MQISLYSFRFIIILLLLAFGSCRKEDGPGLEIKVVASNNLPVSGAGFDVLDDTRRIASRDNTKSTSADGFVRFNLKMERKYYIYLVPNQANSGKYIGNAEASYIPDGTFKTQADIASNPGHTPTPKIGDTKYLDINGDGVVDKYDLVVPIFSSSSKKIMKVNIQLEDN